MESPTEPDLVRGLHAGDLAAWQSLYDAHAPAVWRYVARLLGPQRSEISDVVQETFLAAARGARQFDPARGSLWLWLCGIARRQVALHYRQQGQLDRLARAAASLLERDGELLRSGEAGVPPPDLLVSRELTTLVRQTLSQLPEEYGTLLTARYLDGLEIEQLARDCGCTNQALRARLTRARTAFREAFACYLDRPVELPR